MCSEVVKSNRMGEGMNRPVCPGSGISMAEMDYAVRRITLEDRERHQRDVQRLDGIGKPRRYR